MKTKIFLLAIAIMTSSFAFAVNPVKHAKETNVDKKVLKQIKRKMMHLNVKDYLEEGERQTVVITCAVNENDEVEPLKITGTDNELNEAIDETFEKYPVRYSGSEAEGNFTFKMVLENRPA